MLIFENLYSRWLLNDKPSSLESSKGGHSNKGYSRDITPFVTIVVIIFVHVICNYSCIYSYLLRKSTYLNAVLPANCIFIVIYCIYSIFIPYLLKILFILMNCKSVHVF